MRWVVLCGALSIIGCRDQVSTESGRLIVLTNAVGPHPRALLSADLQASGALRSLEALPLSPRVREILATCGVSFATLKHVRGAIGEPLNVAAEIDGDITRDKLACTLGRNFAVLEDTLGVTVRDRAGGISLSYGALNHLAGQTPLGERGKALLLACANRLACGVAILGRTDDPTHVRLTYQGTTMTVELDGLSDTALVETLVALWNDVLPGDKGAARATGRGLSVTINDYTADPADEWVLALHDGVLAMFTAPNMSMHPTIRQRDTVFIVRQPRADVSVGDIVLVRDEARGDHVTRLIAREGHVVRWPRSGLEVDAVPVPSALVGPADMSGLRDPYVRNASMRLFRESLGGEGHWVMDEPRPWLFVRPPAGPWSVPSGKVFVMDDNRDGGFDSREHGPIPAEWVMGRVAGVAFAWRGNVPDWDRMGARVE